MSVLKRNSVYFGGGVDISNTIDLKRFQPAPEPAQPAKQEPQPEEPKKPDPEQELLEAINATGIGAGGLGGDTTALGVRVKTAPCHIAALPVAVNMGCSALRRLTVEL